MNTRPVWWENETLYKCRRCQDRGWFYPLMSSTAVLRCPCNGGIEPSRDVRTGQ